MNKNADNPNKIYVKCDNTVVTASFRTFIFTTQEAQLSPRDRAMRRVS